MSMEPLPSVRICTACGEEKALNDYYRYQRQGDPRVHYHAYCKRCHGKRARKNPQGVNRMIRSELAGESPFEQYLAEYEQLIGACSKRARQRQRQSGKYVETVVISDLHIPDERSDFLVEICENHKGSNLVIAGDMDDFEMMSRFNQVDWNQPTLRDSLARRDAVLDMLSEYFPSIEILLGNHDLRMPRKAASALGPDYAFISQQFLMWSYERRHGVKLITNDVTLHNGRKVPYLHYYHQLGDCMIGHVEVSGRPVAKGVERAHDFFQSWRDVLGLNPFRVVLQAHTHRQSFYRHPQSRAYCYEIGALCDQPSYALVSRQNYSPVQHGYFHLVQFDGVTDINASRLVSLDN